MFATDRIRLRPATPDDASSLYELWNNPETHLIADDGPFVPRTVESVRAGLEKEVKEPADGSKAVSFAVALVADDSVVGGCSLWGIDEFSRLAHLGIVLLPVSRGQGYGKEVISLLCMYGFRMRNMRRLELETLASNVAMRKTAEACGFTLEGVQRERGYDGNGFGDMAIYGQLKTEWKPS